MKKQRLDRIGQEIMKVVSQTIRELKDPRIHEMTSVTEVNVSNDLSFAEIYVSVLGSDIEKEESVKALKNASGYIRRIVSQELDLRHTPMPKFKLDESMETASSMEQLIKEVRKADKAKYNENNIK